MKIQVVILALFLLNLILIWLFERFRWYRLLGTFLFVVIPLTGVFFDQPRFELDYFWWKWAGMAAILLGLVILFWAKKAMGNVMAKVVDGPKELVASGPYQYLRHPIYLSLIFIFVGWWWIWAAVYTFYFGMFILTMIWLHAYFEEKYILEKLFGDKFRQYKENTGMFWVK